MSVTVKGIYKDGKITLIETPAGVMDGQVELTMTNIPLTTERKVGFLRRGMYRKEGGRMSTWEDFLEEKQEWEREF